MLPLELIADVIYREVSAAYTQERFKVSGESVLDTGDVLGPADRLFAPRKIDAGRWQVQLQNHDSESDQYVS